MSFVVGIWFGCEFAFGFFVIVWVWCVPRLGSPVLGFMVVSVRVSVIWLLLVLV